MYCTVIVESAGPNSIWNPSRYPSGLNAHFPPAALAVEFARFRVAVGLPDHSGLLADGPFPDRRH